jgi:hypothetical protein
MLEFIDHSKESFSAFVTGTLSTIKILRLADVPAGRRQAVVVDA